VSSNCYGANLLKQFTVPIVLIENLRGLMMQYFDIPTKFHNDRNALVIVPVWGVYKNAQIPNPDSSWRGNEQEVVLGPMFLGNSDDDPNIIDGTDPSNVCCDLNASIYVAAIVAEWNDRVDLLMSFSSTTGSIGGSGYGRLLTMTRYAKYVENPEMDVTKISPFVRRRLPDKFIKKRTLTRTTSIKKDKDSKVKDSIVEVYVPPDSSLFIQVSPAVSSIGIITEAAKQSLSYMILPTIVLETGAVPLQRQYRVATLEGNVVDLTPGSDENWIGLNRLAFISNIAGKCAPGIAGSKNDELNNIVDTMNNTGQGGFLGDLIGALGPMLPF